MKQLESRGLIVRQPAIVRTKEVDGEGDSKTTSCISTNMIYLSRYAKPLGSQQRFEICKEDSTSETPMKEHEATATGDSLQSESTRDDTLIKDFLPAMQAICDKLEEANEKVSKFIAFSFLSSWILLVVYLFSWSAGSSRLRH